MFVLALCACAPLEPQRFDLFENVTSSPSGATILWGENRNSLQNPSKTTPSFRPFQGATIAAWCYQVTKVGYLDSDVICRSESTIGRNIHFDLEKATEPAVIFDNTVSITGAASALRKMTTSETYELNPQLSPDKKWLLMQVHEAGENASYKSVLQKISVENSSRIILTRKNNNSRKGTWLPDSSAIVFASDKLGPFTIVQSMGVTGESAVKFITPPSFSPAMYPDVSPDGKQVAFSLYRTEKDNQICVINNDGSNLRVYGDGYAPKWSNDGGKLLFARNVGKYSRIYTMESEAGANLMELSSVEANDRDASWSPDARKIVFISDRTNNRSHLFLMDINGQNIVQLTDGNFDVNSVDWGKDNYIYFSSNAGGNLDIWRLKVNL